MLSVKNNASLFTPYASRLTLHASHLTPNFLIKSLGGPGQIHNSKPNPDSLFYYFACAMNQKGLDIRAKRSVRLFLFGHGAVPKIFWSALGGRAEYIYCLDPDG